MRALGIISDKSIIECCLLDIEKYDSYLDLFIPSVHNAGQIFTQEIALKYIATFTKGKTVNHVLEILMNYLLPNIGELNFRDKACFIGYMVLELLKVFTKEKKPTDRDSFIYKRVELPGSLIYDLDYEKLTRDTLVETKKVIKYLNLNWENACLEPHKNIRSVKTASQQQVRRKVYTGSSEAWHKFSPFLKNIFDDLKYL